MAAPAADMPAALDDAVARLAGELERWSVPGVEVAVVRDGDVLFAGGLGVRGVDDPEPVGPSTWFHHGSCGKAFTGLVAAVLAEEGILDLDAPVRRYVPEFTLPDPVVADRVTTRDLLAHRSGLGRHDLTWILSPSKSRQQLVDSLASLPLAADLRARWIYSNLGYTTAGLVIGRVTDSSWEEQLRLRVLEPAGMGRTTSELDRVTADPDHARPHLLRDAKPVETPFRRLDGAAPAGGLLSCAEDTVRWLLLHTAADGEGPVPAGAVAATREVNIPIPAATSPFPGLRFDGYGLGWVVGSLRGRPIAWHNGGVDGFRTDLLLVPEERVGVLVSANLHATSMTLAAVLDIADALLGTADAGDDSSSWYDRLRPPEAEGPAAAGDPAGTTTADAASASGPGSGPASATGRAPSHDLAGYAGTYDHPGYGELTVSVVDGGLAFRVGESEVGARHRHFDTWDLRYEPLEVDLTASFYTGPDGVVSEVVVPMDPECEPVRFGRRSPAAEGRDAGATVGP
ncbi:MAG TPA: serine hydrolase [Acidimicrobiales bacterium]|nr:serine hydrolase [Acidimicrobiales bacterium]